MFYPGIEGHDLQDLIEPLAFAMFHHYGGIVRDANLVLEVPITLCLHKEIWLIATLGVLNR